MMITYIARAVGSTLTQRPRRGPRFPGWSFNFEVFTRVLKLRSAAIERYPLPRLRAENDQMGDREARRFRNKVERTRQPLGGVDGEWFVARGQKPRRTILYVHGGGYLQGSSRTHAEWTMRLALLTEARVFSVNYRLAPEHKHPAQLEDVLGAYEALLASGVRPEELVVMGDSAGGTLTLALLFTLRDRDRPMPSAAALLSPWVDVMARSGSMQTNARYDWAEPEFFDRWVSAHLPEGHDVRDPKVSPLYANLGGLPPLWLQVGTAELLLDQVRAFAARAKEQGARLEYRELPGMVHNAFLLAAYFPQCRAAVEALAAWVKERGAAGAPG